MCNEAVEADPYTLRHVSDHLIMQEMCNKIMRVRPAAFFLIPDCFKTQEMCIRAVRVNPWQLYDVPDWFVVLREMWYKDVDNDDDLIKWYHDYQKRKAQKSKNKRRVNAYYLAPQSSDGLVHVRRREGGVEVTYSRFKKLSDMKKCYI